VELFEQQRFQVEPRGKYYIKKYALITHLIDLIDQFRNESSIFAFAIGGAFKPQEAGYSIVVAHTDRFSFLALGLGWLGFIKHFTKKFLEIFDLDHNFCKNWGSGFENLLTREIFFRTWFKHFYTLFTHWSKKFFSQILHE
jgi:hypothetical protein